MNDDLYRILIKGGVTSPGELKECVTMLEAAGLSTLSMGSRQDLLFMPEPVAADGNPGNNIREYVIANAEGVVADRGYQNIVTSYVSADIFRMTHWLKGSTYLYLLEQFDFRPRIKINITDPLQRLVPVFSGNLNFIASRHEDYWYLEMRMPHWEHREYYPVLVYSWDIVPLCKLAEELGPELATSNDLFVAAVEKLSDNNRIIDNALQVPYSTFPYYEGMNRMGLDKYWLGLYWRNNRYDLDFLLELCGFCLDNRIGKICITPWKSLIIKGIPATSRDSLEQLLGRRGINVRHSQLEMNWHIPVDDPEALALKQFLVRHFDERDISTYGLTFGISGDVGKRTHFASVIIERNPQTEGVSTGFRTSYNILHAMSFDPNTSEYIPFAQEVDKGALPDLLIELSRIYFGQLGAPGEPSGEASTEAEPIALRQVFQCRDCLSVYDPILGDPPAGIPAGTEFPALPDDYRCSVCDSSLGQFQPADLHVEQSE